MKTRDSANNLLQFIKFFIPIQKALQVDNRIDQKEQHEKFIIRLMAIPEENFDKLYE